MIIKNYKRNSTASIAMILLGLLLSLDTFRGDNFILIYDGLKLLCGILTLILGSWGVATPFAVINNKELTLRLSILKRKAFDLSKTKLDFDTVNDIISFTSDTESIALKLKYLKSSDREELIKDLKNIVK